MYNFDHASLPLLFPVSEGAQLKPWFTLSLLDQGLELIREKRIGSFHSIKNSVGAIIDDNTEVALQFEKSRKLQQGFVVRQRHCSRCCLKATDQACVHLAALFILSIVVQPGPVPKIVPLSFAFYDSSWFKIGSFLHEWFSKASSDKTFFKKRSFETWEVVPDDGSVQLILPEEPLSAANMLFPGNFPKTDQEVSGKALALLDRRLRGWEMNENERRLARSGSRSKGWRKETSCWVWLARILFAILGERVPELHWEPGKLRFMARVDTEEPPAALRILLPRSETWRFIREIPASLTRTQILPPATECYRVTYQNDNSLLVEPCLHLQDGRVLSRQKLAKYRFSEAYFLEEEGFLPTVRLPVEGTFTNPSLQKPALPLCAFIQNQQTRSDSFTVATNDIPAFLEANRIALQYSGNIIDPQLQEMSIRELPDRLVIDSFEEHGDWCYLSCHYGLGNTSITLEDISAARKKKLNSLPGREWLQINKTPLSWFYNLADDRLDPDGSGKIRLSYREVIALVATIPELEVSITDSLPRKRFARLIDISSWSDEDTLSAVPHHLRSYQRNGLAWLVQLYRLGIGGLLADDMGLGKTHQGLALLQSIAGQKEAGKMLVICPASVVLHWADKIDGFYRGLPYTLHYGPQRDLEKIEDQGVVLTTFGVVRRDLEQLQKHRFDIILVDEIQNLKNRGTAIHKAVAALDARVKIGLTGTPIENSLQDLRALFEICLPGLLGSDRHFDEFYLRPISENSSGQARQQLARLIHPFILRRSRGQVLKELPEIIEDDRLCELHEDQLGLYRQVISEREHELDELADETTTIPYMNILAIITRLKQICCHPCLVQGCSDHARYGSGKWDLFVELTEELLSAEMKFVVFSQYTGMLEMIENYLQMAGIGFSSLKGSMTAGKRQQMIDQFNNDSKCRVFCASLLAGGVGIDLTGAQAVIHYDRWWNPAKEEQATARVHRMGQKNVVQVFRLVTRGTLEEKIHNLIIKKRKLATSLIQEDEAGIIKQMDRNQLADLFRETVLDGDGDAS
ncbi:MAG: DEAD/DEAH box helicase [Desulforhopalus sp.]